MAPKALTASQLGALLDILIHHETYAEVQSFQNPEAIETYEWPFVDRDDKGRPVRPRRPSSSPLLQLLLTRLLLGAPAIRDLSNDFWPIKFKGIMQQFGNAALSDSYEKGTLGTRKRLATAASVVHEAVTKALLSGVSHSTLPDLHRSYDKKNADDITRAWHDSICHLVYGDLIDEIFDQLTRTKDLEAHSPGLKRAIEYAELYLATFLHQIFVLSAEGPYLLKLIENVHRLVPYTVVGQTLRVGNAASMINAMSRLFLSKVSVGAISNWIGLTSKAADGMNLMQRIFSMVLEWDAGDFRKASEKMKQNRESISDEHMKAIEEHLASSRSKRELTRQNSIQQQKSIIVAIFEARNPRLLESLTIHQHASCLEYYATQLAIRDREQIIGVICGSSPDLTTAIVLEGLAALDPMIRVVHKNVDLRKHLSSTENFLTDFIKTTKSKTSEGGSQSRLLTVKDFINLLRRNRHLLWAYLHDFCSGCPDLRDSWRCWMKDAIKVFRRKSDVNLYEGVGPISGEAGPAEAGDIGPNLQASFDELTESQKDIAMEKIDAHSEYLATLQRLSKAKLQNIIDDLHGETQTSQGDTLGSGIYAARWEALLDETMITPSVPEGPLRSGKDIKSLKATRKTENQDSSGTRATGAAFLAKHKSRGPTPPDTSAVVDALGSQFKQMVANISQDGLPTV